MSILLSRIPRQRHSADFFLPLFEIIFDLPGRPYRRQCQPDATHQNFISNPALRGSTEYLDLMIIIGLKFPLEGDMAQAYTKTFGELYNGNDEVISSFFSLYDVILNDEGMNILPENEIQLSRLLAGIPSSNLKAYFNTMLEVHSKGYVHLMPLMP